MQYQVIGADTSSLIKSNFESVKSAHDWISDLKHHNKGDKRHMIAVRQTPNKPMAVVELPSDISIARFYLLKSERALENGIEFSLTFAEFKRLSKTTKCRFTGLDLTSSTFTIDRIDNKLGYITGNVAACHKIFNQIKAIAENPVNDITVKMIASGFKKVTDLLKEK